MLKVLTEFLREATATLIAIRGLIWYLMVVPSGLGKTRQVGEVVVAKEIHFKTERDILAVDPVIVQSKGIVKQRHRVILNGVEISNQDIPIGGGVVVFTVGPAGASYTELLDYFDAAGNDSIDLAETTVVVDGVAPDAPLAFGGTRQIEEVPVGEDDPEVPDEDEEDSEGDDVEDDEELEDEDELDEDLEDEDLEDEEDDDTVDL